MPGLVGLVQKTHGPDVGPLFGAMLAALQRGRGVHREVRVAADERWALGCVHLGNTQAIPQFPGNDDIQVLFRGALDNEDELRTALEAEQLPQPGKGVLPLLTSLYQLYGRRGLARLQGSYCAVILDAKAKELVLLNDRLGSYFLYWYDGPQRFVFASELKALLRDSAIKPELDPRSVADYLTFGFLFGNKTLVTQVQLLPAASTLTYKWEEGHYTLERYWHLESAFQDWQGSQDEYGAELCRVFNQAVQRTLTGGQSIGVSLSGGLDSRAIVSAIDGAHAPITTYTLGVKGCADEVIAEKLARIAGTRHQFFELDEGYLGGFVESLQNMVVLTDGMYLTHGLTEMLALQFLEEADFAVLLRGHGGELAKASLAWPFHTDAQIHRMDSTEEFITYILM